MLSNAASLARVFLAAFLLLLLPTPAVVASPAPSPEPEPEPEPGLLGLNIPIVDPLLNLLNNPPPKLLRTTNPTSNCTNINGGELQCCRAMVAGDVQLVVWLAAIYGYQLNPNDINGLNCDNEGESCPGVHVCCQVTTLSPLLSLWCQDI